MLENGCSSWEKEEDGGSSWGEKRKKIRKKRRVTVT
jgi:hypothetical protein